MLSVAWCSVFRCPADHLAAAPLDPAPTAMQPVQGGGKPAAPADAQAPQPSSLDANTAPAAAPASTASPAPGASPGFADKLCSELGGAALANGLPAGFFVRLIWQESRFDIHLVSPKGAKGIAQFMPGTARSRGLADPFDPIPALRQSAQWLKELREQFGNLGLAAAAYNSGPRRVSDWLHRRAKLPGETRDYVKIITGRTADEWVKLGSNADTRNFALAGVGPCNDIAKVLAREQHPGPEQEPHPPPEPKPQAAPEQSAAAIAKLVALQPQPPPDHAPHPPPEREPNSPPEREPNSPSEQSAVADAATDVGQWGLQLTGSWSEAQALAAYRDLQNKFPAILADRAPLVLRGAMAGRGSAPWYRVRVAESSRESAAELCARLQRAGGTCFVFRN